MFQADFHLTSLCSIALSTRIARSNTNDWNAYGADQFVFQVIDQGAKWANKKIRLAEEKKLQIAAKPNAYNILEGNAKPGETNPFYGRKHSQKSKDAIGASMRGVPNDKLGIPISIHGIRYTSLAEASRQTGHSRKLIRDRLQSPNYLEWLKVSEVGP